MIVALDARRTGVNRILNAIETGIVAVDGAVVKTAALEPAQTAAVLPVPIISTVRAKTLGQRSISRRAAKGIDIAGDTR